GGERSIPFKHRELQKLDCEDFLPQLRRASSVASARSSCFPVTFLPQLRRASSVASARSSCFPVVDSTANDSTAKTFLPQLRRASSVASARSCCFPVVDSTANDVSPSTAEGIFRGNCKMLDIGRSLNLLHMTEFNITETTSGCRTQSPKKISRLLA
ncbi:hypothetical protein L9F63_019030, partial [Diploptera punctata]